MNCELIFGRISELFTHHLNSPDRQLNFLKVTNVKINFKIKEKEMKRLLLILLIVMFFLAVNGCSNKDNNPLSIQENDMGTLTKSIEE